MDHGVPDSSKLAKRAHPNSGPDGRPICGRKNLPRAKRSHCDRTLLCGARNIMRHIREIGFALSLTIPGLCAQNPPAKPDNSSVNQQDRQSGATTADSQKDNRNDRTLTQQVRKALVKDKSLSSYAHNVKVVSQNGVVTLKGPVRSEDEKRTVEAKAAEIAGRDNVKSEISVAPKPADSSK
jgi:hyperosmotically inducible periplasmic protein